MSALPLVGPVEVTVEGAREVSIHGDRYCDVTVTVPGGTGPITVRIPATLLPPALRPGDRLRLHMLMSQVDRVEVVTA